jgi:hypothetical protein
VSQAFRVPRLCAGDERFRVKLAMSVGHRAALEGSGQAHPCIVNVVIESGAATPGTVWLSDRSQPAYLKVLERNPGGGVGSGLRCS